MKNVLKPLNILFVFILIFSFYDTKAVMLTNGKDVSKESLDKVIHAIQELKKDATFINKIDNYEIPPMILTEGFYVLGQAGKDGCTKMTPEQFKSLTLQATRHTIIREKETEAELETKIIYLYDRLCSLEIIDENNQISEDDGAVLNASIAGRLDQHIYGIYSRGFKYTNPVGSNSKKLWKL